MASQKRVLIVEDEKPLAHALELKLKHEGFDVVIAQNGQEALYLIEQSKFDVALLDLMMPVVDGFQVLDKAKDNPDKPIFFVLSNLSQKEDEQRVLALGAKKFFIKSNTPLSTIVEEVKSA